MLPRGALLLAALLLVGGSTVDPLELTDPVWDPSPTSTESVDPSLNTVNTSEPTVESVENLTLLDHATSPAEEQSVNTTVKQNMCKYGMEGEEDSVECSLPGDVRLKVKSKRGLYANVHCEGSGVSYLSCTSLPRLQLSPVLPHLALYSCPARLARCVGEALGAGGVRLLRLEGAAGALPEDWRAGGLESLELYWDDEPTEESPLYPVPTRALRSLPALRKFSITNARVQLEAVSFVGSPPLQYLELALDLLQELPPGVFAPLPELRRLNLWKNQLTNITAESFEGLSSLERLSLDSNPLHSLHHTFRHAPRLRELSLRSTQLRHLDNTSFADLHLLEKLDISYTRSRPPLSLQPGALGSLPALRTLLLARSGLTALPAALLVGSAALTSLDLSYNRLTALPADLFATQVKLVSVNLSHNALESLPESPLGPLRQLDELRLDHNRLTALPSRMLEGMERLTKLTLSHNMLLSLSDALRAASSIALLDLSHNNLTLGTDQTESSSYTNVEVGLNSLVRLQSLNLSHNQLHSVPPDLTDLMVQLSTVDLSYNLLTALTSYDLRFVSIENITLDLRHNNISRVFLTPSFTQSSPPPPPRGIALLHDNPFHCDCLFYRLLSRIHGSLPILPELSIQIGETACYSPSRLSHRPLRNIDPQELTCELTSEECPNCTCTLKPASKAIEMSCDMLPNAYPDLKNFSDVSSIDLRLMELPDSLLSVPSEVRSLNFSSLNLTSYPKKLPSHIKLVDLSENLLENVPLDLFAANVTVYLSGNPLPCDCWHRSEMIALQGHASLIADFAALRCGSDALLKISAAKLCETTFAAAIGGILIVIAVILAVAAAFIIIRYSLVIKVFLYSHGWCSRWVTEKHIDDDKEYDAFVSFVNEDRDFVLKELIPILESPEHKFKLNVHYRDWFAGESIATQIARSVDVSRRTIIVLSKNFLKSIWGPAEFQIAFNREVLERRNRIIVILLDDITNHQALDGDMKELKRYLAQKTYLRYGEPMFWDKLIYALPHRKDEEKYRSRGEEIALRLPVDKLAARHVPRPDVVVDRLGDKLGDKLGNKLGAIDARLNSDGKIVNTPALTAPGV